MDEKLSSCECSQKIGVEKTGACLKSPLYSPKANIAILLGKVEHREVNILIFLSISNVFNTHTIFPSISITLSHLSGLIESSLLFE